MATSARAGRGGDPASPSTGLGRCHQPARGRERVESTRRATDGIATTAPPGSRPVQFPHSRLKRPAGSAASFNGDLAKRLRRARGLSPTPRWRFAKSLSILPTLAVRLPLRCRERLQRPSAARSPGMAPPHGARLRSPSPLSRLARRRRPQQRRAARLLVVARGVVVARSNAATHVADVLPHRRRGWDAIFQAEQPPRRAA